MGDHWYKTGDLVNALKSYSRVRDYCTTPQHHVDMLLKIIQVRSLIARGWKEKLNGIKLVVEFSLSFVLLVLPPPKKKRKVSLEANHVAGAQSTLSKLESLRKDLPEGLTQSKLPAFNGLFLLDEMKFKRAAQAFLSVQFSPIQANFSQVLSPNDIAIYGGLCALATFDRKELKSKVIDNSEFKKFLESESQVREVIYGFYNSDYPLVLKLLESLKVSRARSRKSEFVFDTFFPLSPLLSFLSLPLPTHLPLLY